MLAELPRTNCSILMFRRDASFINAKRKTDIHDYVPATRSQEHVLLQVTLPAEAIHAGLGPPRRVYQNPRNIDQGTGCVFLPGNRKC